MDLANFIHVTLTPVQQVLRASDIPTLHATVRNTVSHPIAILTYNSLLDKAAGVLDIIHVIESSTGNEAVSDVVQFQRVWPPTQEAFVEIAPNDKIEVTIPLRTHKLEQGKKYDVMAKWAWQGLWKGGVDVGLEACSKGDTAAGSWNGPTTEVQMQGNLELEK
jgi:hypothetical protein